MLFNYMKDTQRFLREQKQSFVNPQDLIAYINRARREIAMRSQCIRVLTPISGSIVSWTVTDGGTGYSNTPTLTITTPDFPSGVLPYPNGDQATAQAVVQGGVITAIDSTYGGSGYFNPQMTITDTTGSGATATPTLSWINELNQGQEVYPFSGIDLTLNPGCESVYFVRSISIIYNNYRYSLPVYPFSVYQAMIRQYPFQYQYVPTFASQFGQGVNGSFYVYPLPSQSYQYEMDCQCTPQELIDDQSYEAIPQPWQDAVAFYAAHLAFLELQNYNAAKGMLDLYEKFAQRYSDYARAGRVINPYGRF
ncbi:MAG TPA: hypothetical protein VIV09_03000 [Pseudolabrys sp.]